MSQPNLAETRTTEPAEPSPPAADTGGGTAQPRPPSTVTIVELRRAIAAARSTGKSGRKLKNRTWIAWPNGFWAPTGLWTRP